MAITFECKGEKLKAQIEAQKIVVAANPGNPQVQGTLTSLTSQLSAACAGCEDRATCNARQS